MDIESLKGLIGETIKSHQLAKESGDHEKAEELLSFLAVMGDALKKILNIREEIDYQLPKEDSEGNAAVAGDDPQVSHGEEAESDVEEMNVNAQTEPPTMQTLYSPTAEQTFTAPPSIPMLAEVVIGGIATNSKNIQ